MLSYLFPREIEVISTNYNSHLQIVLDGGRLLLNTKDANFSFGELHRVFQYSFKKIQIKNRNIEDTLILGFGAGSVAQILQNELKIPTNIVGIEIDEKIIEIGNNYFELDKIKDLNLVIGDAFQFLENCKDTFDFVVVDVFKELNVPDVVKSREFVLQLKQVLRQNGVMMFNFIVNSRKLEIEFRLIEKILVECFGKVSVMKVRGINRVFVLEK